MLRASPFSFAAAAAAASAVAAAAAAAATLKDALQHNALTQQIV